MNFLYPRFSWRQFLGMLLFGLIGSMVAGGYGILHDQITFRIGPEYFTKFKMLQFYYLDARAPMTLTVSKIGFLATWWVGFFAGWFMGRVTLPHEPMKVAARRSTVGVVGMMVVAAVFAGVAFGLAPGSVDDPRMDHWQSMLAAYDIVDVLGFIRVGYIHNASYLGGLVGLLGALLWLRLSRPASVVGAR